MTTATETRPLTTADIGNLRQIGSVCFRHFPDREMHGQIDGEVIISKYGIEATARFELAADSRIEDYTNGFGGKDGDEKYQAFAMISGFNEVWKSVCAILHQGDILGLRWDRSNFSAEMAQRIGMQEDGVYITIRRKNKRLQFLMDVSVTAVNSVARMIR